MLKSLVGADAPVSPFSPLSPLGPCSPWGPGGPCGPGSPLSPFEPCKKFNPWLSPNPGSPLKSIEKACALWTYAIGRKPVDSTTVNNIDADNLLNEFMFPFYILQCPDIWNPYQKTIK